jgi:hypothetical protein
VTPVEWLENQFDDMYEPHVRVVIMDEVEPSEKVLLTSVNIHKPRPGPIIWLKPDDWYNNEHTECAICNPEYLCEEPLLPA